MNKVDNLKKVRLSIQAGTSPDDMNLTPKNLELNFIFGLGPGGMTPFEYELVDRAEGESVLIHLKKENFLSFFEHLDPPLLDGFEVKDQLYLKVNIDDVTPAESREVIKALADMAAHGGTGCECGCGCGS